jgi:hypothetical protein
MTKKLLGMFREILEQRMITNDGTSIILAHLGIK